MTTTKTMTVAEFEAFIARTDWVREQGVEHTEHREVVRCDEDYDAETDEFTSTDIYGAWGYGWVESKLEGVTIKYTEGFQYELNDSDSFDTSTEGQETVWEIDGVTVVDDDGDEIRYTTDLLTAGFKQIDYSEIIDGINEVEDIDTDEGQDMEKITISRDNEPSLRFSGELVASTSSSADKAMGSSYSGQAGRWTELKLYKTVGGKYVCQSVGRTCWEGERDRYSAAVCDDIAGVIEFFGHRWLAQDLYAEAGIEDVQDIE